MFQPPCHQALPVEWNMFSDWYVPVLQAGSTASQMPAGQLPLRQSLPTIQEAPSSQAPQAPPPQSTSVSEPFSSPSSQATVSQVLLSQTALEQSESTSQLAPSPHAWQTAPPQSRSVSSKFITPSVQYSGTTAASQTRTEPGVT